MGKKTPKSELANWDYYKLVDYADAHIMKSLINGGGRDFHNAIWNMLDLAIRWDKERLK